MKFRINIKKHQYYLVISMILIALFILSNKVISNKTTAVAQTLVDESIQRDLIVKQNMISSEWLNLNELTMSSKQIINNSSHLSAHDIENKLLANCKYFHQKDHIDNVFLFVINNKNIETDSILNSYNPTQQDLLLKQIEQIKTGSQNIDTLLTINESVYNRKILFEKISDTLSVAIGYDINLYSFWNYFSEKPIGVGSYYVLTNKDGFCLLHPDKNYIGKQLNSFFDKISIHEIIDNSKLKSNSKHLQTIVNSEYLNLEVFRYFSVISIDNEPYILTHSFPVEVLFKDSLSKVTQSFTLISILAFITFMSILALSRAQLRKEFYRNLLHEKEKKRLAISNEQYQQKNAVLQLSQLRKKVNPHFLFNSLNSLVSLIDINQDLSQQFVLKLADVYRYLLEERYSNLATVKEELSFLKQYIFLHEIRFKDSLSLNIVEDCDKQTLSKKIPFLALETLVENAIKHNKITKNEPLVIDVLIKTDRITVSNNFNPRQNNETSSHKIGLNYLKNCYEFHKTTSFKTEIFNKNFICTLPLLA